MAIENDILSEITVHMKYARYLPKKNRRENRKELVTRNKKTHIKKYPKLKEEIDWAYEYVYDKKVLPSMRSMQFSGKPTDISPNRIFNCFSEETRFITNEGTKSFADFENGDKIKVLAPSGKYRNAVVKSYGMQKLNKVDFARGRSTKSVYVTKNHRWLLNNGEETTNLEVGSIIRKSPKFLNFDYDNADPMEKLYWCYGYVYGDGSIIRGSNTDYSMVRLCGKDKEKFLYRFEEMGFKTSSPLSCKGDYYAYTGKYKKTAPDIAKDGPEMVSAFMDGYLQADAYKNPDWYRNNELCRYRTIQSSSISHTNFLRDNAEASGYYILNEKDLTGKETNFGVRGPTSSFSFSNFIGSNNSNCWVVKNIDQDVREETVWCLEVEDEQSFVLSGGLVTGNCAYAPIDHMKVFGEIMFLLLGGTGVGYSVQKHHIEKLPEIQKPSEKRTRRFLIGDSIEGWADSVNALIKSYFKGSSRLRFDFSDIRPKGTRLITSGGKAPGPQPLKECLVKVDGILSNKENGDQLNSIEIHDIVCYIADAVLAGGIRRAALISLFSATDHLMLGAKTGKWWERNPQRGRANNSVVIMRHRIDKKTFLKLWDRVRESGAGEPGFYFTNDKDYGCNPCCEISLRPYQFCNLTEVNVSDIESQEEYNNRATAATIIGTLQASYTDFHYLRPCWQRSTEKDYLIGVSMTGIASGKVLDLNMEEASEVVKKANEEIAEKIGISPASRCTTVKPAGTTSLTLGTSSGIHAWHNDHYIRRIRVGKSEAIYQYLADYHPELVEDEYFKPHDTAVISVPQKAPKGSIIRHESALDLLERVKRVYLEWVTTGHRKGQNKNNVSATITIKQDEWEEVGEWMWKNKNNYNGLSVLPFSDHTYKQAPFEDCTEEEYNRLLESLVEINLDKIIETDDETNLTGELACAGGMCELK